MVTIVYNKQSVLVTKEVAEFLEQDDRRLQAQDRSDRRHLLFCELDPEKAIITKREKGVNLVLNQVIQNLEKERLWEAVSELPEQDRLLVRYRYCDELTQQQIGDILGISKMAVCKRLNKLHGRLRELLLSASCVYVGNIILIRYKIY